MRIAIVAPEVFPVPPVRGGAVETVIEEVARCLSNHEVHVFGIADPSLPALETKSHRTYHRCTWNLLDRLLLSYWRLPFRRAGSKWYYWPYSRWVANELNNLQPELVWIHSRVQFVPYIQASAPGAVTVLSLHNASNLAGDKVWREEAVGTVHAITGCSSALTEEIARRRPFCAGKVRVLYNGVDVNAFSANWLHLAERERLREAHALSGGPVVLYVGRLIREKGAHLLIDAFREATGRDETAKLVIVGSYTFSDQRSTSYIESLKNQAQSLGDRVRFVGHVSRNEISKYFLMSDIVAFPSIWTEPFGLVVLEAMATGLPVIAFDRGGPAEVIRHRRTGLLVPLDDGAKGFAEILRELMSDRDLRESVGREARKDVERRFTWQAMANDLLAVTNSIQREAGQATGSSTFRPATRTPLDDNCATGCARRLQ